MRSSASPVQLESRSKLALRVSATSVLLREASNASKELCAFLQYKTLVILRMLAAKSTANKAKLKKGYIFWPAKP